VITGLGPNPKPKKSVVLRQRTLFQAKHRRARKGGVVIARVP
jgi:hypothetical protein